MHACTHAHTHIPLVQLLWGALTDHNSITKNLPPQSLVQVIRWPSLPSSAFYTGGNETLRNQRLSQMMQRVSRGGVSLGPSFWTSPITWTTTVSWLHWKQVVFWGEQEGSDSLNFWKKNVGDLSHWPGSCSDQLCDLSKSPWSPVFSLLIYKVAVIIQAFIYFLWVPG